MTVDSHPGAQLLGRQVPASLHYDPAILRPVARAPARAAIGLSGTLPFHGADVWHAYELSWLQAGRPVVALGRLVVDAATPNIVESKSLKLYLNSLNETEFGTPAALVATVESDVGRLLGGPARLELCSLEDPGFSPTALERHRCIDSAPLSGIPDGPDEGCLRTDAGVARESLCSHLLRSLCPVTSQPDWATVLIDYEGPRLDHGALLTYLLGYRRHQGFHEQCVEKIFVDLLRRTAPIELAVQAFYTRRGGLDICPWRSSRPGQAPRIRLPRQ